MIKKRLSPITISNKKSGNIGKGIITPRHENSLVLYFNEINDSEYNPVISKKEEVELYAKMQSGDERAKDKLIKSNLRFVVSIAKHYQNQGLSFEDLVNEGNIGLVTALNKFDPARDIKFISYAVWWIRQSILQSLAENGKMVRVPINKRDSLLRVNKKISELEHILQRKPTIDEIVESIGDLDAKAVANVMRTNMQQMSLDAPLLNKNGDEDSSLLDILVINEEEDTSTRNENISYEMNEMLGNLSDTERNIIEMYFGLFTDRKYTLDEIGVKYNVTRERIRQIKTKAIRCLRNNPKIQNLIQYANEE